MKILFAASEAFPFCKTGGLADVAGSLPVSLAENGDQVAVILPLYDKIGEQWRRQMTFRRYIYVDLGWRHEYCGLFSLERQGVTWYFVDNEKYFRRGRLYGEFDDGERFAFFSHAVIDLLPSLDWMPDVLHCNDWQSALVPIYIRDEAVRDDFYKGIRTVITVHNIEYQGKCNLQFNYDVLGLGAGCDEILRFDDCTNFMKSAIVTADRVTTVSETYAQELRYPYYSHGLDGVLQSRGSDFSGITNGIDMQVFDPAKIENIAQNFTAKTLREGKIANKLALQQRVGLPEDRDVAVLAMVTRLVGHKGIDLLCYIAERLIQRRIQLVIIGTGEEKYEWYLNTLRERFGDKVSVNLLFDGGLANLVYAASDLYLMPSKSEPCGLSQLIAMRMGSVPVVNATGGLKDTVWPYNEADETGRGFTFQSYNADDFLAAIDRALALYYNEPEKWLRLAENDMAVDSSWDVPAQKYMALFQNVCGQ